ncbi:ethanolamine ammonia-lyase subunit EutB [Planctomyces sp. SH-PL14]|uniref:ethanolamine ammonia-lyase subunit EutB n=1 Tax=Planctomyces sp. SH-PL14 TaxID=1632864 RepID=UPI00078C0A1F|nr:ethanolamine ammonia-lyase subunit EutB [Planctomyces sp. SH-PL14]AMV22591.1 Ethanolamine ammonia-lyase heavy chain [Planctomyces sp. SH-PL14]
MTAPSWTRREFIASLTGGSLALLSTPWAWGEGSRDPLASPQPDEGVAQYVQRVTGRFDDTLYKRILGSANEFKEGDAIVGVAAADDNERSHARQILLQTKLGEIDAHPPLIDDLYRHLQSSLDPAVQTRLSGWTFAELKTFLLTQDEPAIHMVLPGLSSDVIGCLVKLLTNAELTTLGARVFHPLPGSQIGAKGYLGARIQPNSPTDNVDDIRWQVLCGFSYAVGDVVLGNNPVSSDPRSVAAIERTLREVLEVFELTDALPHCVLAHIDVQAEVERTEPGSTALWFQSIAGSDTANATFDLTLEKMLRYAESRTGPYGLYFETGQGADFTNGHGHGFDMVLHESRKYGFARLLSQKVAAARARAGHPGRPWVHLNDVAGFIGPEVFRTREQLVRCCLEDIVMGKLHGLCIGLDVCSTLHMSVSLDDLDWCLEQLVPAQPAYLMALPTKIDPMLGYLTTGYQDHVRLREKFGCKVNDRMWRFFQELGVIDESGRPTEHFGDPLWVYLQYCRRKHDDRPDDAILAEGRAGMAAVRGRGLFLAEGWGERPSDLAPRLRQEIRRIYDDSKESIWAEFDDRFTPSIPAATLLATRSADRRDYILHPETGETLSEPAAMSLAALKERHAGRYDVQVVISDGLNALAIMDRQQLQPFLETLRSSLLRENFRVAPEHLVVRSGRVRAGYRIGEALFAGLDGRRALIHVIGERPGSGHRTFSVYLTAPEGATWGATGTTGRVDHHLTRVVAGIANTALVPDKGADEVTRLLKELWTA